jgi:hypothetical protein
MLLLAFLAHVVLGLLALRGVRWAYVAFIVLALLYFPAKVGFRLSPHACELSFSPSLAAFSLTNYPHIVLFAVFFVLTSAQFRTATPSAFVWAVLVTLTMGALVEMAEGITGRGHCRLRDLIPDLAGALLGAVVVMLWKRARGAFAPSTDTGGSRLR